MGTRDNRVDAYIVRAAEFAQPILARARARGMPRGERNDQVGFPHFEYKGVLCSMASFKAHCAFGFWHGEIRAITAVPSGGDAAMGQFGRITKLGDLPKDAALKALIRKAAALNGAGVKSTRTASPKPKTPRQVPADLTAALRRRKGALVNFQAMSPSHQHEYIEWLVDAKREETRDKRLATAIDWIAEGKSKEWKYRGG